MEPLPKYFRNVVSRIVSSADSGPLRRIINGRALKPTGTFISLKAGSRAMPWESEKCELPVLELAEYSTRIISLLSQPHRLELFVKGGAQPLLYFPDLEVTVEDDFLQDLRSGMPFSEAALLWRPKRNRNTAKQRLVLEIKDDNDRRNDDPVYQRKLELAREVYSKIGIHFLTIKRSKDIDCGAMRILREVLMDRYTRVTPVDLDAVTTHLDEAGGLTSFDGLVDSLGGGIAGRAKALALHFRRAVSIDFFATACLTRPVRLVGAPSKEDGIRALGVAA